MRILTPDQVLHTSRFGLGSELYAVVAAETQKKKLSFQAPHCGFSSSGMPRLRLRQST